MDRLLSMRAFRHVVDEGGFRAAAPRLGVSPPAITRLIEDLEGWLGTRLLNRNTRSVTLTQAGEKFLERVRGILAGIDAANAAVHADACTISGQLRILSLPAVAAHHVLPAIARMRQLHPGVSIDLHVSHAPATMVDQFDVTILNQDTPLPPERVVRRIASCSMALYASPRYVRPHGQPLAPQDLAGHALLTMQGRERRPPPFELAQPAHPERKSRVDVAPALTFNNMSLLVEATLDALGIALLPAFAVACHLAEGRLQQVLSSWVSTKPLCLIATVANRQFLPQRVITFLDLLSADNGQESEDVSRIALAA